MYLYSSTQVCPALVNGLPLPYSQLRPSHSVRFAEIHKDGICPSCVDVTKYTTIYSYPVVFLKYIWEYFTLGRFTNGGITYLEDMYT